MCDLRSKFEDENSLRPTAVAIANERCGEQTDRQTDRHSSDFISVHCHALHRTDNDRNQSYTVENITQPTQIRQCATELELLSA